MQGFKARTFLHGLQRAQPCAGDRLLDVGCAQGELAKAAAGIGLDVLGIDINEDAIERARELVPRASFHCGELDADVVGCNSDIATMFDFIELVRQPRVTLRSAHTVLRVRGAGFSCRHRGPDPSHTT